MGNAGIFAYGTIFRGFNAAFHGCFTMLLGYRTSIFAEIFAIKAIEIASSMIWCFIWLENDFTVLVTVIPSSFEYND